MVQYQGLYTLDIFAHNIEIKRYKTKTAFVWMFILNLLHLTISLEVKGFFSPYHSFENEKMPIKR
jgi:hypothetical protein